MKKLVVMLTMVIMISLCGTTVMAHNGHGMHSQNKGQGTGVCGGCRNYADANVDGICDNQGKGTCGERNCMDANGDGICDNQGKGMCGGGRNYTDADGDGICDNKEYAIRYKLNGGKNNKNNPSVYSKTTKTIRLKKPSRKGYVFKGWYSNKKYKKKVTVIKKGSSGTKTLYAKWVKK